MNENYRVLFARGESRRLIAGLGIAWLSFGMVALAILLTMHHAGRSYGLAGVGVAAFSIGAGALAPARGRLLDRRGTQPWLVTFALGYAVALVAFDVLARRGTPSLVLLGLAALAGASAPPLVASLRALWPSVVEEALVRRAYALTSVVGDVGLVAAPALAGVLFVAVSWLPLLLCAAFAVAAALVVARRDPSRADEGPGHGARLLGHGFAVLLAVEIALGIALGLVEVAVPTAAARWGATAYSGLLLAAFAGGSVVGGVWFGQRSWRVGPERRYLLAALLLAVTLVPPALATGPIALAPLLVVAGMSYGPATISLFEALDNLTTSRATEAFTWLTASAAVGTAAGSAVAGWATTNVGLWAPFAAGAMTLAVTAAVGLALRNRAAEVLQRK